MGARVQSHETPLEGLDATSSSEGATPSPKGLRSLPPIVPLCVNQALTESGMLDHLALGPALARLTADQRRVLELRFLDDLRMAEVAAIMGKTEDGVKKLQARGLAALRRILVAQGADAGAMLAAA